MLLLALIVSFTAFALTPEELAGNWETKWTKVPSPEAGLRMKQQDAYTFNADGTHQTASAMQLSIVAHPNTIDCFFYLKAAGTWAIEGDTLKVHYDPATVQVDFPQDEIRISGPMDMGTVGLVRSQIASQMSALLPEVQKSVTDDAFTGVVIEPDGKKWKATADKREVTFFRKDKKK